MLALGLVHESRLVTLLGRRCANPRLAQFLVERSSGEIHPENTLRHPIEQMARLQGHRLPIGVAYPPHPDYPLARIDPEHPCNHGTGLIFFHPDDLARRLHTALSHVLGEACQTPRALTHL